MRRLPALLSTTVVLAGMVFTIAATKPTPQKKKKSSHAAASSGVGNADAITLNELKDYDYFMASDQIEGRNLPSRGYDLAALYVASHLSEWGLTPGGSTSGTNGPLQPYFIPMDLVTTQPNPAEMKLTVNIPAARSAGRGRGGFGRGAQLTPGAHELRYGHDWMVAAGGRGAPPLAGASFSDAGVVFAGNGYVIGSDNPYQGLDVRGKVVVVAGVPPALAAYQAATAAARARRGSSAGPAPVNPMGSGDMTPAQYAAKNGAVAVISIPNFQQLTAMAAPDAGELHFGANGPNYSVSKFLPENAAPAVPELTAGIDTVNALFQGEKLSAAAVFDAAGANKPLASFALEPGKTLSANVAVNTAHNHGEDVIAMLPGSDPVLKNEYVVMSAHLDHIGMTNPPAGCVPNPELAAGDSVADGFPITDPVKCDVINNGGDDDGSGTTGLLGIAHAFAEGAAKGMRPKRTMIFLWNAGEEKGLWGSQYFNEFPPVDISKVVVDLNMDMIGRDKRPDSIDPDPSHYLVDPGAVLVVGPNISSNDLENTLESVNGNFQKLKLDHFYDVTAPDATHDNLGPGPQGQRIFYRSDHYNFAKMGIPIAFFSDGLHVDYHRPTDSPDKVDFNMILQVSKTAAAVAWVIGNEPEGATPKLNATLPPLLVRDMAAAKAAGWGKLTPVLPPLPGEPF